MRKSKIYLDTSVVNFLFADDAPDFRRVTEEFFGKYASYYDLFASDIVLLEISRDSNKEHREKLQNVLRTHPVNMLSSDVEEIRSLAELYMQKGVVPVNKIEDALHIAVATYYEMDILLSWNFKHLANIRKELKVLTVNLAEGYRYPLRLVSPLEVEDEK